MHTVQAESLAAAVLVVISSAAGWRRKHVGVLCFMPEARSTGARSSTAAAGTQSSNCGCTVARPLAPQCGAGYEGRQGPHHGCRCGSSLPYCKYMAHLLVVSKGHGLLLVVCMKQHALLTSTVTPSSADGIGLLCTQWRHKCFRRAQRRWHGGRCGCYAIHCMSAKPDLRSS